MRLAKLSLAAIVALGVSAFADVQNVKFGGDAKLFYGTVDAGQYDLFDKKNSYGQAALDVSASADLADSVKGKFVLTGLGTLGLENNLVSGLWAGVTDRTGNVVGLNAQWWLKEAWLAKTFGNTTLKVGRQELDTPLAFTEKWNIAENTFDAAVLLNNDLPQTTLVAAWVGKGNGAPGQVVYGVNNGNDPFQSYGSALVSSYGLGSPVGAKGAYAFAGVTKLIPMTTAQVWYYNVKSIADAWWLQADIDLKEVLPGLTFGAQWADINPTKKVDQFAGAKLKDSKAWAVKLGYAMDNLKLAAAYSKADKKGIVAVANTATGAVVGSQSKLYTEAWWNYGYVGAPNAKTLSLSAEYSMEGVADFGAYYTSVKDAYSQIPQSIQASVTPLKNDMTEFTLTASKSFGNLNATLAYIYTDADDQNYNDANNNGVRDANEKADSYNTVQVYLTYNF